MVCSLGAACAQRAAQTDGQVQVQPAQGPQASAQSATTTPGVKVGQGAQPPNAGKTPSKDDLLRGGYGPYRANNDLLFYHLSLRVDPEKKTIASTNVVRFRMLQDGRKIQLELTPELTLESIKFEGKALTYTREERTLFVEFPRVLRKGEVDAVFADGLTLAVWLAGQESADCCVFKGGPYTESRFFGEGVGIAVRKEDPDLRRAMDWALARLAARGVYAEIYLKYFPIGFY